MKNNGLFKYIVQITCILALSYAAQIYSLNIDLKQLFGTWQCLQDDKKHLSPLNGAICAETGWIENIYRFGEVDSEVVLKDGRQVFKKREESKRRIKQNATSELVFLLFNAFPNIDGIHVSKSPASPATVLTLALIGQLINEIEKLMGSGCSILFDLSNDDEFNGIIGDAKKAFEKSEESQNLLSKQKKLQSLLKEQKKAKKDPSIKEVPRETKQLGIKIAEIQKQLDLQSEQLVQKHITNKYEMLIKMMNNFYDICDKKIKIVLDSPDANKAANTIQQLLKKFKPRDADNFLQLILKSLFECGLLKLQPLDLTLQKGPMVIGSNKYNVIVSEKDLPKDKLPAIQELQFVPYTTHNVLLSFLAMKLSTPDDLKAYFSSFTPSIMKDNWQEQCKLQVEKDIKQFEAIRTSTNYEKTLEDACKNKKLQECYELIACTEIEMLNPRQAPKRFIYGTSIIEIDGKTYSFSDCTETSLLNFICLVLTKLDLYDWEKKSFLLNDNERVKKAISWLITQELQVKKTEQKPTQEEIDERIKNFLPDKFFDFFAKDAWKDPIEAHNMWAQLISNKSDEGFEYLNNNTYELKPDPKNFVAAFNYLFGSSCDTFDQICSILEIYDYKNKNTFSLGKFEKNKKYVGTAMWRISKDFVPSIDITFNLSFSPGHAVFALARNESDATPFIESIFKESTTNQLIMLLTYLYAYRNLKLDKRLELIGFSKELGEHKLAIFRNMLYSYDFAKTRTRRMNLIEWLYKTEEKISNKEILTAKLDEYKDSDGDTLLNCAIAWDENEVAKLLIEHGTNINEKNNLGNTPLHTAVYQDKSDIIELLIKNGANINEKNNKGDTPLHTAVRQGKSDIIDILIKNGANINEKNNKGDTPLHAAVRQGKSAIVDILIKNGANINKKNNLGNTPLHTAVRQGKSDIVDILIKNGANINKKNNNGESPLHIAAYWDNTIVIKLLINKGAKINEKDNLGNTPLHTAVRQDKSDIVDILIKNGANINEKNNNGESPLHIAAYWENTIVIKLLINKGAKINEKDNQGNTPLHKAITDNRRWHAAALLVKNGSNINEKNNNSETPLELAKKILNTEKISLVDALLSNNETAEFIAACGIGINEKDLQGNTTLHLAISNGQIDIAREVIEQFVKIHSDLNMQNELGDTALHTALYNDQPDIAHVLIAQLINDQADLNIQNNEKYTPLHLAIIQNKPDLINSLIGQITKTHSDLNVSNKWGRTALHEAIINEQLETSRILIDRLIKDEANLNIQSITGNTPLHLAIMHNLLEITKSLIDQLIKNKADLNIRNKNNETPLDLARKYGYNDIVKLLEEGIKQTK